jgi:hypothetical protein
MEATGLAFGFWGKVKGQEGRDIGGAAVLEDLAMWCAVSHGSCPDIVLGEGFRANKIGGRRGRRQVGGGSGGGRLGGA